MLSDKTVVLFYLICIQGIIISCQQYKQHSNIRPPTYLNDVKKFAPLVNYELPKRVPPEFHSRSTTTRSGFEMTERQNSWKPLSYNVNTRNPDKAEQPKPICSGNTYLGCGEQKKENKQDVQYNTDTILNRNKFDRNEDKFNTIETTTDESQSTFSELDDRVAPEIVSAFLG